MRRNGTWRVKRRTKRSSPEMELDIAGCLRIRRLFKKETYPSGSAYLPSGSHSPLKYSAASVAGSQDGVFLCGVNLQRG